MNMDFDSLPWHDAQLLLISIDRTEAGNRDEICVRVRWPDMTISTVIFLDVYVLRSEMNFGVVALESVLSADVVAEREDIAQIRNRWAPLGIPLEDLKCYEIETNSTASKLRIYARAFKVKDDEI